MAFKTTPRLWINIEDDDNKTTQIEIPNPVYPPVDSDVQLFGMNYGAASGLGDFVNYGYTGEATVVSAN